jgi:hypothetical protein
VYGPESSQLVLARNLVPSAGVFGTTHFQSLFLYQSIETLKSVTGMAVFFAECYRPSAIRFAGSATKDCSAFDPGRWYMNRSYSPCSMSDLAKSRSRKPSMFELVVLSVWLTTPLWFLSVHSLPSWLTSVQL